MKRILNTLASLLVVGVLSAGLAAAQTASASRYDASIQTRAAQRLAQKQEFRNVQATAEDSIITLTGKVDLYQQKLDAAKRVRKVDHAQGVRNLIAVAGETVPDVKLTAQLDRKLYYDRIGYDNLFNYVTASVKDGVVTLEGATRTPYDRESALSLVDNTPGVKDVVNNVKVLPVSSFDDAIRLRAARVIYGNAVLNRYAIDPALPIRIVVDNGHITLYGTVDSKAAKEIAGIQANSVPGVFSVQNNLRVVKAS
jgi:hyperosmotically inducible periplasmic protein